MLSKKAKYGLTALIHLARNRKNSPILISDLAEKGRIPKKFLELILLELKKQGILQSKKGKGGGYYLSRPPELVRVGHVIRILDGTIAPIGCVSETAYEKCEECGDEEHCPIRMVMKDVRDAIANILDRVTLAEMVKMPRLRKRVLT
jgi:Rrf2 family protein